MIEPSFRSTRFCPAITGRPVAPRVAGSSRGIYASLPMRVSRAAQAASLELSSGARRTRESFPEANRILPREMLPWLSATAVLATAESRRDSSVERAERGDWSRFLASHSNRSC